MRPVSKYSFTKINVLGLAIISFSILSFKIVSGWQDIQPDAAAKELITLNKNIVKNERYSFNVKYTSYKEHEETRPYESQSGKVIKDGIYMYSKLNGALTIQNKDVRVVVDSLKQFIKITDPLEGPEPNFNVGDYVKVLNVCKSVKRKEEEKTIAYRFEPKAGKGIVAQEIYLTENFLKKSVIYYVNENNIRENNQIITQTVYPRLEIVISDFKKLEKVDKSIFNIENIISINKKEITAKEKYKTFKLFDGRYKN